MLDGDWLVMTRLPGRSLAELAATAEAVDDSPVRRDLGGALAAVHAITGAGFGYDGGRLAGPSWRAVFGALVDELLADAETWQVELPAAPARIRELVDRHGDVLDLVTRPALVHFDGWDGNVLAAPDTGGGLRLTGLVDGERYLLGDPLVDFVTPALYRRIEDEPHHPFLDGYARAGAPVALDGPARRRLALYRLHLYLLMAVEMPSRGMTGEPWRDRRDRIDDLLDQQLSEVSRGGDGPDRGSRGDRRRNCAPDSDPESPAVLPGENRPRGQSGGVSGSTSRVRWTTFVRAGLGAACLLVPAWVAVTRWSTLVAGHPAYPGLLAVLVLVGVVLLARVGRPRSGGRWRTVGRTAGALLLVAVLAGAAWLRPFAAEPVAVAATASGPTVSVVDSPTTWELRPHGGPVGVGVAFFPGALVDPRAYLALLRPLAERGYLVVVVKPPFGVALLSSAQAAIDAHPEVTRWAVGGHSLGGVAAATQAASGDQRVRGVFFWASYPNRDLSRAPLAAASIRGDRDAVISQARADGSRTQLPPDTGFTVVPGAVHAFFGDYGPQPGDGTPGTSRADAQREIVAATERFLAEVARPDR